MDEVLIRVLSDADIVGARQKGRQLASDMGFSATDATVIATAISELGRNIVMHAREGEIILKVQPHPDFCLVIIARDDGPGIPDLGRAMEDGYSTYGGLGLGLPGTRRLMDTFEIQSVPGKGTVVTAKKCRRLPPSARSLS